MLYDPSNCTSTVQLSITDIPQTERHRLKDDHLSSYQRP